MCSEEFGLVATELMRLGLETVLVATKLWPLFKSLSLEKSGQFTYCITSFSLSAHWCFKNG